VVNLNSRTGGVTSVIAPWNLEVFNAATRTWTPANAHRAELRLPPGGGKLVREATPSKR
jgi:hypothetical protein